MPYHEDNSQDLIDHEDEILVPRSNMVPFVAMFCIGCSLYFGLRISEWWFAPPPVVFPQPVVQVIQDISPTAAFPNENYYVVPTNFTCEHKRAEGLLKVTCRPIRK